MFNSLSDTSIFKYAESMGNNKISVIINKIVKDTDLTIWPLNE